MTVSEIMQAKMGRPLFPTNYNFMKFYSEYYSMIDPFIRIMYGGMKTIVDDVNTFDILVGGYLTTQKDALEKRYNVLRTEYNPIWNVDGTEETQSENTQSGSISNAKNGTMSTTKSGSVVTDNGGTITNTKSGNITTDNGGTITNTKSGSVSRENGEVTTTVVNQKNPFESDGFVDDSKQTSTTPTNSSTETYNNVSDTQTMNNVKSTETYNNVTDSQTFNNYGDTQTFNNVKNVSRETLTRQGNIGVTSTQSLIEQELSIRLNDFYMILFAEILNTICYGWEE